MRGINEATGTVHEAKSEGTELIQACGAQRTQRLFLAPTDAPLTCRRCSGRTPAQPKAARSGTKPASTGPTTWGIFIGSAMQAFRPTRKEALEAAERIGGGAKVRKIL